jgi:hypothetical protein
MDMNTSLIRKPSALIPLAMAFVALALPIGYVALNGLARQEDEGTAAHLWQFLIAAQVPFVAFFAIKWLPRAPKQALVILALQAGVVFAAFAAVFIMESMAR